jgi:hypothetical protein
MEDEGITVKINECHGAAMTGQKPSACGLYQSFYF